MLKTRALVAFICASSHATVDAAKRDASMYDAVGCTVRGIKMCGFKNSNSMNTVIRANYINNYV